MMRAVKSYKVLLDEQTTNADKNIIVDFGDMFQFQDQRDLIDLRSETYMDNFFNTENPTIDFEKYKFKPESMLEGIDFYFYRESILTLAPISYDDLLPPVWAIDNPTYMMSSGFKLVDVPKSILFLDSYFKFEFSLDPTSQKVLFSITLPLDGTMLQAGETPRPKIDFSAATKTELQHIYWLRNPQQLAPFSGDTFDLYCLVSFFNSKTGKVINFRRDMVPNILTNDDMLPGKPQLLTKHTMRDKYIMYRLDYNDLTYKILQVDGQPFNSNRIKLYAM